VTEQATIDVGRLVADLQRRASVNRERGLYDQTLLSAPFDLDPLGGPDDMLVAGLGPIRLRPQLGFSSKPGVGSAITLTKRVAERLVHHVVQDGLDQAALRIEHLSRSIEDAERRGEERIESQGRTLRAMMQRESLRRVELAEDGARLLERLQELTDQVSRLTERIDRLERDRPEPPPA
jgi:polyhydroxyalkanoate synthesis regulator phasin